jgi:hypothetical protein
MVNTGFRRSKPMRCPHATHGVHARSYDLAAHDLYEELIIPFPSQSESLLGAAENAARFVARHQS